MSVIKNLCDDESTFNDENIVGFDGIENDKITVTIESPKIILHQQLKYIMRFINNYNENGKLCCKLDVLRNELNLRKIISTNDQFENIKLLIDREQFKIDKNYIICKV